MITQEKRSFVRYILPSQIQCFINTGLENIKKVSIYNISNGGLNVRLSRKLDGGERISLFLTFCEGEMPIEIRSSVIWCKRCAGKKEDYFLAGIEYLNVMPEEKERFAKYVCKAIIGNLIMRGQE